MFSSLQLSFLLAGVLLLSDSVYCNTEKTIFVAPEAVPIPADAAIDNLLLTPLNPLNPTFRTFLNATFPDENNPKGVDTWVLLNGLEPNRRYEVRVCWLATQPTSFWIDTHTLAEAFENSDLISSLSSYAYARHSLLTPTDIDFLSTRRPDPSDTNKTILLLRIQAAADYFTLDQLLMKSVPQVHVDIILDPYLLNVFPSSLLPTAAYIAIIAFFAWFASAWIYDLLFRLSRSLSTAKSTQAVKKLQ